MCQRAKHAACPGIILAPNFGYREGVAISSVNKFSKIKRISVGVLVEKPLSCYKHSLNFVKH